jgi:hypothetical protein
MITTWFIGVQGVANGYNTAAFLRAGRLPDVASALQHVRGGDIVDLAALDRVAQLDAIAAAVAATFPLAVAKLLLSAVLVVASGMAMSGRRGARAFALQVLLVNAALAAIEYVLTRGVRAAWVDTILRAAQTLPEMLPERDHFTSKELLVWVARFRETAVDLAGLALGVWALTRRRTRTYFDAVARLSQHTDEP